MSAESRHGPLMYANYLIPLIFHPLVSAAVRG
jgi:hypothetical protein